MSSIIPRNTQIPIEKTKEYSTSSDNQTSLKIQVLQGESELASDNHKVAKFNIGNIRSAPKGQEKIDVSFRIDANGILEVTARDKRTGNEESLTIAKEELNLPQAEI